jgi:hypothetical protein
MTPIETDFATLDALSDQISRWCLNFQQTLDQRPVANLELTLPIEQGLPQTGCGAGAPSIKAEKY